MALFSSPMTRNGTAYFFSSRFNMPRCQRIISRTVQAMETRRNTRTNGGISATATFANKKEPPQMAPRTVSMIQLRSGIARSLLE